MKLIPALLCAVATVASVVPSTIYAQTSSEHAGTIVITAPALSLPNSGVPGPLAADTPDLSADQLRYQAELSDAISHATAPKPHKILDNTTMDYRLNILGDLFTPGEKAALSASSRVYNAAREMVKDTSPTRLPVSELGSRGSAYSRGISTSILTAADPTGNVWNPLTSWFVPGGTLRSNLGNQIAPMVWDMSEKSRDLSFGGAGFLEKSVVFLPNGGSITSQLEMAEFKVGLQSLVSGRWPNFSRLSDINYEKFCKVWLRRVANVAMANYISTLLTPKNAGKPGYAAKLHGPPPVTVNYRY